jgi:hypothetical protein
MRREPRRPTVTSSSTQMEKTQQEFAKEDWKSCTAPMPAFDSPHLDSLPHHESASTRQAKLHIDVNSTSYVDLAMRLPQHDAQKQHRASNLNRLRKLETCLCSSHQEAILTVHASTRRACVVVIKRLF